jgi:hypothetical protein
VVVTVTSVTASPPASNPVAISLMCCPPHQ